MYLPDTPSLSVKASDGDIARATMRALPAIFQRRIERARNGSEAKALVVMLPHFFLRLSYSTPSCNLQGALTLQSLK